MRLDIQEFVKIATSAQEFAILNKTEQNEKDVYVVFGEDNVVPPYNSTTFNDAFVLRSNHAPMDITRSGIPGAVYVAPVSTFAFLGIKVWTE